MKNPFFYLFVALSIVVIGFVSFQFGKTTGGNGEVVEEKNPIIAVYKSLSPQAQALYYKQSDKLTKPVAKRLVELDEKTIGCFGPAAVLGMSPSDENLGGQCCGALTSHEAYTIQLQALQNFIAENGGRGLIPEDPYDVPVSVAQTLTRYDQEISLNTEQQATYDEAMDMSHHGGPCCCKCWKWYVMSGLAKNLIAEEGWNAHQIAELWDTSSSCGHAEDTNMHQHYETGNEHLHDG